MKTENIAEDREKREGSWDRDEIGFIPSSVISLQQQIFSEVSWEREEIAFIPLSVILLQLEIFSKEMFLNFVKNDLRFRSERDGLNELKDFTAEVILEISR